MSNNFTFWEATRDDLEGVDQQQDFLTAKVKTAAYWPFLAAAKSEAEFEGRLDLTSEKIQTTAGLQFGKVIGSLREDFKGLQKERLEARESSLKAVAADLAKKSLPIPHVQVTKHAGFFQVDHVASGTFQNNIHKGTDESAAMTEARKFGQFNSMPVFVNGEPDNEFLKESVRVVGPADPYYNKIVQSRTADLENPEYFNYASQSWERSDAKSGPFYHEAGASSNAYWGEDDPKGPSPRHYDEGYSHGTEGSEYKGYASSSKAISYGQGYKDGKAGNPVAGTEPKPKKKPAGKNAARSLGHDPEDENEANYTNGNRHAERGEEDPMHPDDDDYMKGWNEGKGKKTSSLQPEFFNQASQRWEKIAYSDPTAGQRYNEPDYNPPVDNGPLQGPDGFPVDLAQGEQRTPDAYARQLTPGQWTDNPQDWVERPMNMQPGPATRNNSGWAAQAPQKTSSFWDDGPGKARPVRERWADHGKSHVDAYDLGFQHGSSGSGANQPGGTETIKKAYNHGYVNGASTKTSSVGGGEGIVPTPGPNPHYFENGQEGLASNPRDGFPLDPSLDEEADNRVNQYGGVPPQQSSGSSEGVNGPYSQNLNSTAVRYGQHFNPARATNVLVYHTGYTHGQEGQGFKQLSKNDHARSYALGYAHGTEDQEMTATAKNQADYREPNRWLAGPGYNAGKAGWELGQSHGQAGRHDPEAYQAEKSRHPQEPTIFDREYLRGFSSNMGDDRGNSLTDSSPGARPNAFDKAIPETYDTRPPSKQRHGSFDPTVAGKHEKAPDWMSPGELMEEGHQHALAGMPAQRNNEHYFRGYASGMNNRKDMYATAADYKSRPSLANPNGSGDDYTNKTWNAQTEQRPLQDANERNSNTPTLPGEPVRVVDTNNPGATNRDEDEEDQ